MLNAVRNAVRQWPEPAKFNMICITSTGPGLNYLVDPRFGRCQFFLIIDSEGKLIKTLPNSGVSFTRGAGIAAAQTMADEGAKVVITGNVGPNAFMALGQSGIKIYLVPPGAKAKQALDLFNQGRLIEAQSAVPCSGPIAPPFGPGRRGRGGRRGGRRGDR